MTLKPRKPTRKAEHPRQPIVWSRRPQDGRGGVIRFLSNAIVRDVYDVAAQHGLSLNDIARNEYSQRDREQFAQLIGYSVSGFGELPYARRRVVAEADAEAANMYAKRHPARQALKQTKERR